MPVLQLVVRTCTLRFGARRETVVGFLIFALEGHHNGSSKIKEPKVY